MSADNSPGRNTERSLDQEGNEAAAEIVRNVESTFPGSRAGILVVRSHMHNPERRITIIDQGQTKGPMFAASMTKTAWIVGGLSLAEAIAKRPKAPVPLQSITIPLSSESQNAIREELESDFKRSDILIGASMSLQEMIDLTLGMSANMPLVAWKDWIDTQLPTGQKAPDFIQEQTENVLKAALGTNDILWTTTGSQKADNNNMWNCASLQELLTFNSLVADADRRLGLSPESMQLVQQALTQTADADIELGGRLQGNPKVKRVLGKSGYFPTTELGDIALLPEQYGVGPGMRWLMHLGTVERVEMSSTHYDIGFMVALPTNVEADADFDELMSRGENTALNPLKRQASSMMADNIVSLIK